MMTEKLRSSNIRVYKIKACDISRDKNTFGKKPPEGVVSSDVNKCAGLLPEIELALNSRIMIRRNISLSEGLVNGATGNI